MITSKENQWVSAAVKLKEKKGRVEQGKFLIEGRKLIYDAKKHCVKFDKIFVTQENFENFKDFSCEIFIVTEQVIKYLSDTKTNQGAVAVAYLPLQKEYDGTKALLLDRIQDPRNIGAIIRTACASGYKNVFLIDCADVFSPKAIRCGMSGQFMLNFIETTALDFSAKYGDCFIVCADMLGENIFNAQCPENHILVFGNEGQGVSEDLAKLAKLTVSIPMENNLESLNVAVSGGIIMYQLSRTQWR